VILPMLNAFIVAEAPQGELLWGRVVAMHVELHRCVLHVPGINDPEVDVLEFPPWKLVHCHHQPVAEYIMVDRKETFFDGADDSLAWRLTREAVARAMTNFSKYEGELL
jgi:hypothetical protein